LADLQDYLGASDTPEASYLLTSLSNIAWILNLRGSDIPYNPFFYAYLLVGRENITLFVQEEAFGHEVRKVLEKDGVQVKSYRSVWDELKGVKVCHILISKW
jgi:Xaa-Pro aminopeptidase